MWEGEGRDLKCGRERAETTNVGGDHNLHVTLLPHVAAILIQMKSSLTFHNFSRVKVVPHTCKG